MVQITCDEESDLSQLVSEDDGMTEEFRLWCEGWLKRNGITLE